MNRTEFANFCDQSLAGTLQVLGVLRASETIQLELHRALELSLTALRAGGRVFVCGNGGSAAQATHFAGELVGPFNDRQRPAYSAMALGFDTSATTAVANDFSYDEVFARQLQGLGRTGDVLWALSTSGRSANVLRALEQARAMKVGRVLFTGRSGEPAASLADIVLTVPHDETPRIQEAHLVFGHLLCEGIERALTGSPA